MEPSEFVVMYRPSDVLANGDIRYLRLVEVNEPVEPGGKIVTWEKTALVKNIRLATPYDHRQIGAICKKYRHRGKKAHLSAMACALLPLEDGEPVERVPTSTLEPSSSELCVIIYEHRSVKPKLRPGYLQRDVTPDGHYSGVTARMVWSINDATVYDTLDDALTARKACMFLPRTKANEYHPGKILKLPQGD